MGNLPWFSSSWWVAGLLSALSLGVAVWVLVVVRRSRLPARLSLESPALAAQVQKLQVSLEEEIQRRLAQGQMLISFAHDLRQPLQAIAAHRSMLSERLASRQDLGPDGQGVDDGLA